MLIGILLKYIVMYPALQPSFFERDTCDVARTILGYTWRVTQYNTEITGIINEVEAYTDTDPASHTYLRSVTPRNQVMYLSAGHIYIYRIYGLHHCFNIVTENEGKGCAILIRSIVLLTGAEHVRSRRGHVPYSEWCNGPGKLMQASALSPALNGSALWESGCPLKIGYPYHAPQDVSATSRIGIRNGRDRMWRWVAYHFDDGRSLWGV